MQHPFMKGRKGFDQQLFRFSRLASITIVKQSMSCCEISQKCAQLTSPEDQTSDANDGFVCGASERAIAYLC